MLTSEEEIEQEIVGFYKCLYGETSGHWFLVENVQWVSLEENWKVWLERSFDLEESQKAVFSLGNLKSPGPDGFTNEFFNKSWNILKHDLLGVFQDRFRNGIINRRTNENMFA